MTISLHWFVFAILFLSFHLFAHGDLDGGDAQSGTIPKQVLRTKRSKNLLLNQHIVQVNI